MSETSHNPVSAEATASDPAEAIIDKFLDAIWMERGLSANTLGAYRADLVSLRRWLADRDVSLIFAARSDLLAFIAWRIAHETAIAMGGKTIAVLGTPLSETYPAKNKELLETIKRDHLAVSQFPEG